MMTLLQAQKGMPANHSQHKRLEKRLSCILRWKHRKSCSFRALERAGGHGSGYAKRWVSRYKEEKSVQNRPRAGRPSKLSSRDILFIKNLVQTDEKVGCTEIARKLASELGVRVSAETVRNNLIKSGFKYTSPRKTLQHTRIQKIRRLKWSKAYRNTHKLAFSKVMFTDSKIFTLNPSIATCSAQRWHAMGTRSSVAPARQSKGVHVYM
jgi:transposase